MEMRINLDMNNIDYDAINKQIQEKIAEMDLTKSYDFKYRIDSKIDQEISDLVAYHLKSSKWGNLTERSKKEINDTIYNEIRKLVEPEIDAIFSKIPEEELNKIISDLIPKVLVDLLSTALKDTLLGYWNMSRDFIIHDAADMIKGSMMI